MKHNSEPLPIILHGLVLLALFVSLFVTYSKITKYRANMNIINNIGYDIYAYLIEIGFNPEMAKIVLSQFAHETGNFQSKIFKENHNVCGMKFVGQKNAKGTKNGHADYENIYNSITDFQIYYTINRYAKIYNTVGAYVKELKDKGYFQAKPEEYERGMKHFYILYFGKA